MINSETSTQYRAEWLMKSSEKFSDEQSGGNIGVNDLIKTRK